MPVSLPFTPSSSSSSADSAVPETKQLRFSLLPQFLASSSFASRAEYTALSTTEEPAYSHSHSSPPQPPSRQTSLPFSSSIASTSSSRLDSPTSSAISGNTSSAAGLAALAPPAAVRAARITGTKKRWVVLFGVLVVGAVVLGGANGVSSLEDAGAEGEVGQVGKVWGWREKWEGLKDGDWLGAGWRGEKESEDVTSERIGPEGETMPGELLKTTWEKVAEKVALSSSSFSSSTLPISVTLAGSSLSPPPSPIAGLASTLPPASPSSTALASTQLPTTRKPLNVHPSPKPPPTSEQEAKNMRYLSFENHSGFHNQRKSLVNALVLSRLLNRTLLLPPARLGSPIPWGPEVNDRLTHSERCKAGLEQDPIATSTNDHRIGDEMCDDPSRWTLVGWEWLIQKEVFDEFQVVDRWNSSEEVFYTSLEEGGLGLSRDEVQRFEDPERRSYQIYDDPSTPFDEEGLFTSRLDLDSLTASPARLLQFGSLFSGTRMVLSKEENKGLMRRTYDGMVLGNEGLDRISEEVKGLLGSYIGVHARVGDGVFKSHARPNMLKVFRKLTQNVFGLSSKTVDGLLAPYTPQENPKMRRRVRRADLQPLSSRSTPEEEDLDDEEEEIPDLFFRSFVSSSQSKRTSSSSSSFSLTKRGPTNPLSPLLHCRKPLHLPPTSPSPSPDLTPLNTPLYIATDSRNPFDPTGPLAPFFEYFPCVFLLGDFLGEGEGEGEEGVEGGRVLEEGAEVESLRELVQSGEGDDREGGEGGGAKWVSDWDGLALKGFLYPFLEAEISARAVEVVGTPQSTFSGYTSGLLHDAYVAKGLVAGWEDEE